MRSFSSSAERSRASRATCSTSFIVILGSAIGLQLLEVRVLERQALAADAGEVHGGDDVAALALDADEQPLAPARVAELGADAEREIVVRRVAAGRRRPRRRTDGSGRER